MLATLLGGDFGPLNTPFEPRPGSFIALTVLGFMIAAFGHLIESKLVVGTGLALAFLGILLIPLGLYLGGNY
jgi:hypothetical protein